MWIREPRERGLNVKRIAIAAMHHETNTFALEHNDKPDGPVHFHYPGPSVATDFGGGFEA